MEYSKIAPILTLLWSPLTAVTCSWRGKTNAQIAVAIGGASVVPTIPRVLVQIYKRNYSHDLIYNSKVFALNFLREDQPHFIKDFGLLSGRDIDKLAQVPWDLGVTGSPILKECWGYFDCSIVNAMDGGDMTCFLAEVVAGETFSDAKPLWWREARQLLPLDWMEEWDRKIQEEIAYSTTRMKEIAYRPWQF